MKIRKVLFGFLFIQMSWAQNLGVILFEDRDFQGSHEVFASDDPDLSNNTIGFHQASSIRVPPGWTAVLFAQANYQGLSITVDGDIPRLSKTKFGNDLVASIQVLGNESTGASQMTEGVVLYDQAGCQGRSETLISDDDNLKDSIVGNDRVRSIRIPQGVKVTLFENKEYEGRTEVFLSDDADLSDNVIGADSASSIKIDLYDVAVLGVSSEGVTVFEHQNFEGVAEPFFADDPNLEDNLIGKNRASSLKVPVGFVVTLFARKGFKGKSIELRGDIWDLRQTKLGNDKSGSIKVRTEETSLGGMTGTQTKVAQRVRTKTPKVITTKKEQTPKNNVPQKPKKPKKQIQKKPPVVVQPPPKVDPNQVAVILFSGIYFGGVREELTASDSNLADNAIAAQGLGSLQVLAGYKVTLFDQPNFQGNSETLIFDDADMSDNAIDGKSVSSIRIER